MRAPNETQEKDTKGGAPKEILMEKDTKARGVSKRNTEEEFKQYKGSKH